MSGRTDEKGRAYAGSQRQIQTYVNWRSGELNAALIENTPLDPASEITWVSPVKNDRFREYKDKEFLGALGLDRLWGQLQDFWPKGGPVWDGLARFGDKGNGEPEGVILVEAKSHIPEIRGLGCQAEAQASIEKIDKALDRAKRWIGAGPGENWHRKKKLYQTINRLAHLYFLREIAEIPAWMVNVYFVGDPHSPTSMEMWENELPKIKSDLGLSRETPFCLELFLEASQ